MKNITIFEYLLVVFFGAKVTEMTRTEASDWLLQCDVQVTFKN